MTTVAEATKSIWDPISTDKPSKADVTLNSRFEKYLDSIEPLATEKEIENRKQILHDIQKIVNKWVQQVSKEQGFMAEALRTACGKVFTFGSFRLGLITPSSDIDTLVVAPKHISREDFFGSLLPILEQNKEVSELSGVPDAVVPIIKMKFRDAEVDLTFARLNLPVIDSKLEDLKSNDLLKHLDEKTVRSINGTRVADDMLSLVPNPQTYRTVLRFIRNWAKKRGLYSNAMGFFGGITWAILSARVCQMYPNFTPLQICNKFFLVFSRWNWSNPVTLCPITQSNEVGLMGFKIWNPRINHSDKFHLMPIITPSFPCMNSTYNVTETTRRLLISEFSRGSEIIAKFSTQDTEFNILKELTITPPFLCLFSHYLVIDIVCESESAYNKLKGFVESRIRMLLKFLESPNSGQLKFSRPWPKEFEETLSTDSESNHIRKCCWLIGLSFDSSETSICDLRPSITSFHEKLNEWSEKDNFANGTDYSIRLYHIGRKSGIMKDIVKSIGSDSLLYSQQVYDWLCSNESAPGDTEMTSSWSASAGQQQPSPLDSVPPVLKKRKILVEIGHDV